jgi:hypothetical protein
MIFMMRGMNESSSIFVCCVVVLWSYFEDFLVKNERRPDAFFTRTPFSRVPKGRSLQITLSYTDNNDARIPIQKRVNENDFHPTIIQPCVHSKLKLVSQQQQLLITNYYYCCTYLLSK